MMQSSCKRSTGASRPAIAPMVPGGSGTTCSKRAWPAASTGSSGSCGRMPCEPVPGVVASRETMANDPSLPTIFLIATSGRRARTRSGARISATSGRPRPRLKWGRAGPVLPTRGGLVNESGAMPHSSWTHSSLSGHCSAMPCRAVDGQGEETSGTIRPSRASSFPSGPNGPCARSTEPVTPHALTSLTTSYASTTRDVGIRSWAI